VDLISDLEFGLAEELMVGLGGEQISQGPEVGVGGLAERSIDAIGECGLIVGQAELGHGSPP